MNYRSLANKGRKGDSEIRNVAGRRSHVNKREANLIDMLGIKGEALTQALGAGTRNPMTGMPEYHIEKGWTGLPKINAHNSQHALTSAIDVANPVSSIINVAETWTGKESGINTLGELIVDPSKKMIDTGQVEENLGLDSEEDGNNWNLDFDPSSEEFRTMVTETGDYSLLNEGYGFEAGDTQFFDKPNMDQLGFISEQADLDTATITENLRSATASVDIGRQSSSIQAGRNITGNRQQGDLARSRSNMATAGTIDTQQGAASKGIWQDYRQQQKTLSNQMTSAQSAFDLGTKTVDLTKRRGESQFWEGIESDYYAMAGNLLSD